MRHHECCTYEWVNESMLLLIKLIHPADGSHSRLCTAACRRLPPSQMSVGHRKPRWHKVLTFYGTGLPALEVSKLSQPAPYSH